MARLPVPQPNEQNAAACDYLTKTRGAVRGGFAVMLASPEVAQRIAHVGTYVRFDSPLPALARELASTVVSAELENPVETPLHAKRCRELGVPESVVRAIEQRAPLEGASEEVRLVAGFCRELTRTHKLAQDTFDAARARYGDSGVTDLVATAGYYAMLAICHVALDVKPEG